MKYRSDPLVHMVQPMTLELLNDVALRFLTAEAREVITAETIDDHDSWLPYDDMFIGIKARSGLAFMEVKYHPLNRHLFFIT